MQKPIQIYKPRGLYGKALVRLKELEQDIKGIPIEGVIPNADVREKLGRNFSIKKQEVKELIFFLRDVRAIDICKRGIKLNFIIINDD